MLNNGIDPPQPYICHRCMLVEREEMNALGRVLPPQQWAMNDPTALAPARPAKEIQR